MSLPIFPMFRCLTCGHDLTLDQLGDHHCRPRRRTLPDLILIVRDWMHR
jgi:hypothetical protein